MKLKPVNEEFIAELALTLRPVRTGLPFDIWISEKCYASGKHHRPRLKVADRSSGIGLSVAIDNPIQILAGDAIAAKAWNKLVRYINLNQRLLLALWNEEIDQVDYQASHKPIQ